MKSCKRGSKIDLQNGIHFLTTLSREPGRCKKKERERVPARPASPGRPGPDHGLSLFLFASARLSRQSSWKMNAILKVNLTSTLTRLHFPTTPRWSMGPRTMVCRNHGYRNGAKNDKISDHCFVTNGVRFQWKNELRPVSKRARRDLSLTKGLSLPGRQWIRVILGKLKNIDIFFWKKTKSI